MKVKVRPSMRDIEKEQDKNKAWKRCKHVVLHAPCGPLRGDIRDKEFIGYLFDPDNYPLSGPWVPVIHLDTLHIVHPRFTACEGTA